jgi:hypothetical protein
LSQVHGFSGDPDSLDRRSKPPHRLAQEYGCLNEGPLAHGQSIVR